jgi:predicted dithiol-disulfide oxidoreductase (DUF899 family)
MRTEHKTGTREEWLAARLELLKAEKELTRRSDELARRRQPLPWERIDKDYVFDIAKGEQSLHDLLAGRSPLLVHHFMFGPTSTEGCAAWTLHAENFGSAIVHLEQRDVTVLCVSRAPLARLNAYKKRMGLTTRGVSSLRSDFNYDFGVSLRPGDDPDKVPFNFGTTWFSNRQEHIGVSAFALEDGVVYHTYACHLCGVEEFNVTYQLLDRVPRGGDEDKLPYHHAWIAGTNMAPLVSRIAAPKRLESVAIIEGRMR